jgi:DUF4097 and DUF4098 domain-containing protein YvlB
MNKLTKKITIERIMNKLLTKVVGISFLSIGFAMPGFADEDKISRTFEVQASSHFNLSNINGSVSISAWEKNIIEVTAIIDTNNESDRDKISIIMDENAHGVNVETKYEKNTSRNNHNSGSVSYHVMVPIDADLSQIELINGSLSINGVKGEVNVELVNGSMVANGLAGNSEINSVNGSIKVHYTSADEALSRIELETVNGSIKLYLPENISASVDAQTMHGNIKNDFGLRSDKKMFIGKALHGDIGSGDVKINIESVNGSVKLLKE